MSKSRKTNTLKYDLKKRGRAITGQDRSNVDMQAMVEQINSAKTQELVNTGSLIGFYGHQIRQRFGMFPPETAIIDGKVVRLEPAFKTKLIKAYPDGTVEHQHEFLDNESGEFARRQYLANGGGFSTAVTYKPMGSKLVPTLFAGFDFVWQPNYATNVGDGQLFDGLYVPESPDVGIPLFDSATNPQQLEPVAALLAHTLEQQILQNFDSMHAQMQLTTHTEQAFSQVEVLMQENQHLRDRQARRAELQRQRQADLYDGMSGEVMPFEQYMEEARAFTAAQQEQEQQIFDEVKKQSKGVAPWVFGMLTGI